MGLFNNNEEKEVSTGATIGYFLLISAGILLLAFLLFVGFKKITGDKSDNAEATQVEVIEDIEAETGWDDE